MDFALKNIGSAGFGYSKFKSAGFGYRKMHFGMQASAPFFGSLQALDSKNQRKKVVCRLRHPPWYTPFKDGKSCVHNMTSFFWLLKAISLPKIENNKKK